MSEEERKFLEIVDLKKGFGSGETRQEVLRGMNFSVAKGEFCVLLGPSGSGKSTLLNIIGGIDSADSGYISINGDKLKDMSEKKLTQYRRKHLGYVFQMYNLIANLNVKENIEVGAYLSDNALDIDELLHTLGLYEHRYKLPNQLSGGQQQRVSIGRAIVKNPDILLCDEPTGALDYNTSKEILKLIEDVNKKYGNTIIMVTHNEAIKNMADHVIKLRDGAVRHNDININKVYKKNRSIHPDEVEQAIAIEQICFPPNEACSPKAMTERIAKVQYYMREKSLLQQQLSCQYLRLGLVKFMEMLILSGQFVQL